MIITFLSEHNFCGKLYAAGDMAEVEDAIGIALINGGYVESTPDKTAPKISQTNSETEN